jgi:hypothetical protein
MKRWLLGSLALNVLLIGIGVGFLATSSLPLPPKFPPFGPRPGIQRDLVRAVEETLPEPQRGRALAILDRNFKGMQRPGMPPPRPADLLRDFVEGRTPAALPMSDPGFEERRQHEGEAVIRAMVEMEEALSRPERQALATALTRRMEGVRACLDGASPK